LINWLSPVLSTGRKIFYLEAGMQGVFLKNEIWSLSLLPEWGGRIGSLRTGGLDLFAPVDVESFDPLAWPRAGAYPLMPYCNRLRNASLSFGAAQYDLPAHPTALPHTLHGVSHTQRWQVEEADASHVVLVCEYRGEHWPWPIRCEQHFRLEGDALVIELRLINQGESLMPGGIGLHPYFQRNEGLKARFTVGKSWPITPDYLALPEPNQVLNAITIDAAASEEHAHYLSEWDGNLWLDYPEGQLRMHASEPLSHFVAFAPAGTSYLCLEPVSHLADAFNRDASQWPAVGTQLVAPGECLAATITFTWQARPAGGV